MRLTAIKLAGFKSFVDATTFTAPSNLTGIVGPNGCGKSNIIDAVRWVMGEGSAKVLRGESMADVIFSGSSSRKPVGTASVELIFDNTTGRIAGEFASYNEISVKRVIGRDGVSQFTLNGTRCRRKDVRDMFLGTGLGSKSYSIIEQGMISQVVEAGPEEVRSHLEEAAGISRYKDRRRETERRIKHTRENLDRLTDLRDEITSHLNRLKRQANAAERYRKLKIEQRELEANLLALQWSSLQSDTKIGHSGLAVQETAMQEQIAEQRAAEARMESIHQDQAGAGEAFNEVQGELYSVGSEIARLERDYTIRINIPEFTCLCPKTGQPDFATLLLEYIPDRQCVELKSLKMYVWSFRDEGAFHEAVTNEILDDLVSATAPRFMRLTAIFNVRGGIDTTVIVEHRAAGWLPSVPVKLP
ncbi:preQ(1) synthase [Pseudomonadota bacterium]